MDKAYKRPESVLVLVSTLGGDVLLLERTRPQGFWQSVTGSLEWGESPREAALRELYEETGLRGGSSLQDCHHRERFPIRPPWRARYAPDAFTNTEHWFRLVLPGRRMVRHSRHEHRQHRWLPAVQAWQKASSWTNQAAIRRYLLGI